MGTEFLDARIVITEIMNQKTEYCDHNPNSLATCWYVLFINQLSLSVSNRQYWLDGQTNGGNNWSEKAAILAEIRLFTRG